MCELDFSPKSADFVASCPQRLDECAQFLTRLARITANSKENCAAVAHFIEDDGRSHFLPSSLASSKDLLGFRQATL